MIVSVPLRESVGRERGVGNLLIAAVEKQLLTVFGTRNQNALDEWRSFIEIPVAALRIAIAETGGVESDFFVIREQHFERDQQAQSDLDGVVMLFFGELQNFGRGYAVKVFVDLHRLIDRVFLPQRGF